MLNVLIDTSPLGNANAIRGVGQYTKLLIEHLHAQGKVNIITNENATNEPIDVVHYPFFDLFFATLPLKRPGKKTIVTVHDVIPLKFPHFYKPGIKGKLRFWQQKWNLQGVDAVITDSQSSKHDITQHLGIAPEKIHVIYLAANPHLKSVADEDIQKIRRQYRLPKKYVLYVGDINYNKNLPQLIKAFKYLPTDLHLVCVGKNFTPQEIPEWRWIEAQTAMSDVTKQVHFISELSIQATADLAGIYSGAAVYVQPSLYEGFGLPVLEAMQCKTPVVSARNSSLIEVGGDQVVFTGTEAEELAKGIEEVINWSDSHRQKVVKDAFKWSQNFTWDKTATQTLGVYESTST